MVSLEERVKSQLEEIRMRGLRRELSSPRGIDLSSNDYLGLAADERLKMALIEGVKREGVGSTASRLLRGERGCFASAERNFARWKAVERALYFSSGYQANIGLLQTFLEKDDLVFSDELNHASLIDGMRLTKSRKLVFRHLDLEQLAKLLGETSCKGQKFLVTESLFSMDGDIAPLGEYGEICRKTNTNLIVDEAHAVGIYGESGSGLIEHFGIEKDVFLSINTAGKAMGVAGAFVAGENWVIEYLINRCRSFIFSTAPLPATADALESAIDIIENGAQRRKDLQHLCRVFHDLLIENGFETPVDQTQIIPILIGDSAKAVRIAEALQAAGFDVRAIRPPTVPEGTSRLRVSLNTKLTERILRDFVRQLRLASVGA